MQTSIGRVNMLTLCSILSAASVFGLWLVPTQGTYLSFVVFVRHFLRSYHITAAHHACGNFLVYRTTLRQVALCTLDVALGASLGLLSLGYSYLHLEHNKRLHIKALSIIMDHY